MVKKLVKKSFLDLSTSGDLDNGLGYYGKFDIEDGTEGAAEMGVTMDGISLRFGSDTSGGTEKIKKQNQT